MSDLDYVYPRDMSHTTGQGRQTWHWSDDVGQSRCGRVLLIVDDPWKPHEVPHRRRCWASGCKQLWEMVP
jgi:hypothetical protein